MSVCENKKSVFDLRQNTKKRVNEKVSRFIHIYMPKTLKTEMDFELRQKQRFQKAQSKC